MADGNISVAIAFGHIPETIGLGAVQLIRPDHPYRGGLRVTQHPGTVGRTFGLGISMHFNSHLGISLAAMTHFGGVTIPIPNLCCARHAHSLRPPCRLSVAGTRSHHRRQTEDGRRAACAATRTGSGHDVGLRGAGAVAPQTG